MRDTYYLCHVPMHGWNIILPQKDYNYMRNHERGLYVPDPDNNLVLLAQGTKREMMLYYKLAGDLTNVS